jgi:hypothetical protein
MQRSGVNDATAPAAEWQVGTHRGRLSVREIPGRILRSS